MHNTRKLSILAPFFCLLLLLAAIFFWRWMYPFGRRAALLPNVGAALNTYASDHGGWFPNGTSDNYAALTKLYPEYCSATELAGVSGNSHATKLTLEQHASLTRSTTSWMYFPGFRSDDPGDVAILWDCTAGFYWDGRRNFCGGRPVLFADRGISNIPLASWDSFVKQQEQLRRSITAKRVKQ